MGEGSGGGIEIGCFVEGVDFSREKDRERWGEIICGMRKSGEMAGKRRIDR